MLQERLAAARSVQSALHDAERSGSAALKAAAHLVSSMLDARDDAALGPIFGQMSITSAAAAVASFTQGMKHMYDAHVALKDHKIEAGLRAYSFGDETYTPTGSIEDEEARAVTALGVVGSQPSRIHAVA